MASLGTKLDERPTFAGFGSGSENGYEPRLLPVRNNNFRVRQSLFVIADLCGITCGAFLAIGLRYPQKAVGSGVPASVLNQLAVAVLYAVLIILFCNTQKLYSAYQASSRTKEFLAIAKSILLATLLLSGFLFVSGVRTTSRFVISASAISGLICMCAWRQFRRRSIRLSAADGVSCHNVLIVGTGGLAHAVAQHLAEHRHLGFVVVGHLATHNEVPEEGVKVLGGMEHLDRLCRTHFIDEILICAHDRGAVMQVIEEARAFSVGVRVIPDLYDGMALGARLDYLGDFPSMAVLHRSTQAIPLAIKRIVDVAASGLGLALLSPILVLLAILVKLDSPGPVFYISQRVGKKGRAFQCFKFRTMVVDADHLRKKLEHLNERDGILFKITNDPRITRIGAFMRKHSLDELAQLWNVLKGDMSLVGPRPPLVSEVKQYQLEYLRRLEVAPGITGLWQVEARNNPSFDRYISLDLRYVENWSLTLDLQILLRTFAVVCAGTGA